MMTKKQKNDTDDNLDFDMSVDDTPEDDTNKRVDKLLRMKELDENNPLERAEKFNMIKQHPVKPGYMEIRCYEVGKDDNGDPIVWSVSKQEDGTIKKVEHGPFMVVDPHMLYASNIAQCPMNVVPMLIDQAEQQVELRKDTFIRKKEKRGEFDWWWIVFILLIIAGIVPIALTLFIKFLG